MQHKSAELKKIGFLVTVVVGLCLEYYCFGLSTPLSLPVGFKDMPWLLCVPLILMVSRDFRTNEGLSRSESATAMWLCLILALLTCFLHGVFVDEGQLFPGVTNRETQWNLHLAVMNKAAIGLPHSYRFLPNALVESFRFWNNDFRSSVSLYRISFQFLIFIFLLKTALAWGRNLATALIALLFYSLTYPISLLNYAGQLTDPMSHLSFILALYFIFKKNWIWFCAVLLIGLLAKESIILMTPVYWYFHRGDRGSRQLFVRSLVLGIGALALLLLVRWSILGMVPEGVQISGVAGDHYLRNFCDNKTVWLPGLFYLIAIWWPLLFFDLSDKGRVLVHIAAYLFFGIFVSSLFFSWLREFRNFVPVIMPMALLFSERFEALGFGGKVKVPVGGE